MRLAELCQSVAETHADARAIVSDAGRISYAELMQRAVAAAAGIQRVSDRGGAVAICIKPGVDLVVAIVATTLAGRTYVPFEADAVSTISERRGLGVGVSLLVTDGSAAWSAPVVSAGVADLISAGRGGRPDRAPASAAAYIMFTSGTSGGAKGVAVPESAIINLAHQPDYCEIRAGDTIAQYSNVAFDASTFEIWGALLNGASIACLPEGAAADTRLLEEALDRHGVTTAFFTTALLNVLITIRPEILARRRTVLFGGERANAALVRVALSSCPKTRFVHVYGPTETTTFATAFDVRENQSLVAADVPIGSAIRGVSCRVFGEEMRPTPQGEAGEVFIGGAGLALGYWDDPDLTERRFVKDENGARWYRTGDLVRVEQDQLVFVGRRDRQVKVRGRRIELEAVERALCDLTGVVDAHVLVVDQGERAVLQAHVALAAGGPQDPQVLRAAAARWIPAHMVPDSIIQWRELPRNANGKIDVDQLRAKQAPSPGPAASGDTEEIVVAVWQRVLAHGDFARDSGFFEVGGNSLLVLRIVHELNRRFEVDLSVVEFLSNATVQALAELLVRKSAQIASAESSWGARREV